MALPVTLLLTAVAFTQLISANPIHNNNEQNGATHDVRENLARRATDSILLDMLRVMFKLEAGIKEIKTTQTGQQQSVADLTDKVAAHYNLTLQLQKDTKSGGNRAPPSQNKVCPKDFTYIKAINGCYKLVRAKLEWAVAQLRCRSLHEDAHLVFINNAEEQRHIRSLLSYYKPGHCWTGGQRIDLSRRSAFVWKRNPTDGAAGATDGMEEMPYTNWNTGQPNYIDSKEYCVYLYEPSHYKWHDCACSWKINPVCELDL